MKLSKNEEKVLNDLIDHSKENIAYFKAEKKSDYIRIKNLEKKNKIRVVEQSLRSFPYSQSYDFGRTTTYHIAYYTMYTVKII